jgi:hypothetical protein
MRGNPASSPFLQQAMEIASFDPGMYKVVESWAINIDVGLQPNQASDNQPVGDRVHFSPWKHVNFKAFKSLT